MLYHYLFFLFFYLSTVICEDPTFFDRKEFSTQKQLKHLILDIAKLPRDGTTDAKILEAVDKAEKAGFLKKANPVMFEKAMYDAFEYLKRMEKDLTSRDKLKKAAAKNFFVNGQDPLHNIRSLTDTLSGKMDWNLNRVNARLNNFITKAPNGLKLNRIPMTGRGALLTGVALGMGGYTLGSILSNYETRPYKPKPKVESSSHRENPSFKDESLKDDEDDDLKF